MPRPGDFDHPRIRILDAGHDPQQRRLSRPVFADEADTFTARYDKGDVSQHATILESFRHSVDSQMHRKNRRKCVQGKPLVLEGDLSGDTPQTQDGLALK